MFVSHPQYEFRIDPASEEADCRHWRMVELSLHAPWFLLSVDFVDPGAPDVDITRTLCIAWEYDLAEVLRSLDADQVMGIVCMMPAWESPTGQWWPREIREVWIYSSPAGRHVVLADTSGEKFDCGLIPEHVGEIDMELVLRVDPKATGKGVNRRTRPAVRHEKESS